MHAAIIADIKQDGMRVSIEEARLDEIGDGGFAGPG